MPQVLVRDIEPDLLEHLKGRAARNARSLQAELKHILEQAARASEVDASALAARVRKKLSGRRHSDSAALLAADRRR